MTPGDCLNWVNTLGMETTRGWEYLAAVTEGAAVLIAGVDPWGADWAAVPVGSVVVADPVHPNQQHSMSAYRLVGVEPVVLFAAGEFSNGVWGFYEPSESMRKFLLSRLR